MAFPPFHPSAASLVKKHLTPEIYARLKERKTASGFTLDNAIASGVAHPDSSIGIYAGDAESYHLFSDIFCPIIQDYHGLDLSQTQFTGGMAPVDLAPLDPHGRFIRSVRIRVARNLAVFPFACHMSETHRLAVEKQVEEAVAGLPPDISGEYIRFSGLTPEAYESLLARKLVFPKGDRFQEAAGMNRHFPLGRGVFLSSDKSFRLWVNEEDHLRVMAIKTDADIAKVYRWLTRGLVSLEKSLSFSYDPVLGCLNSCPTNVGTGMRAGAHIHLPKLGKEQNILEALARSHHLQIRGTRGEKTAVEDAIFDISNARRLGIPAHQIIMDLHRGLAAIIQVEESL